MLSALSCLVKFYICSETQFEMLRFLWGKITITLSSVGMGKITITGWPARTKIRSSSLQLQLLMHTPIPHLHCCWFCLVLVMTFDPLFYQIFIVHSRTALTSLLAKSFQDHNSLIYFLWLSQFLTLDICQFHFFIYFIKKKFDILGGFSNAWIFKCMFCKPSRSALQLGMLNSALTDFLAHHSGQKTGFKC